MKTIRAMVDEIIARCSKFSGWTLVWRAEGREITIEEPGKPKSFKVFSVGAGNRFLHERVGRTRNWGIDRKEEDTLVKFLLFHDSVPQIVDMEWDPHEFSFYWIKEWDDSMDVVFARRMGNGYAEMVYPDGVRNEVPVEHFNGLSPIPF